MPQVDLEGEAAGLVDKGDLEGARNMLAHHTNDSAIAAVSSYHVLFDTLVARYHDGYQMEVGKGEGRAAREREIHNRSPLVGKTNKHKTVACPPLFSWEGGGFAPVESSRQWVV